MSMDQIRQTIRQMIEISDKEFENFLSRCIVKKFKRYEVVSRPNIVPNEIFFVNKGLIRVIVTDKDGTEHSLHFALENQFIADYSAFMLKQPSLYTLQTEEETETVVMPRAAIEWGYKNLKQGDKLGRLIAEVFPNIHDRVPQHMIASYLGITPIHLSRLKKASIKKI
ncbi:Cyclic nucleotide-binding domain-containing protein [Hydrobacter penzbergensis]|uniref:Cyclic nucleotide-binding domain-containing protein n=2 Tax=Hydrobacter penzbergensis TaxID=1235997 RepID=A0A8X8IGI3_9BACT|nr:Cyclic nucleotide-binding domain-containing protein [Hydrobacter penzbergensis]